MSALLYRLQEPKYIGDGVYARHDGYQIWLETLGSMNVQRIALEPEVLSNLLSYNEACNILIKQIREEQVRKATEPKASD